MRKIFIIICLLFAQIGYCAVTDSSSNSFEIELTQVPEGSKPHSGLSGGAVTAIALGSTFGGLGILSGIGYYFLKHSKGLACGFACGEKCPYQLVTIVPPELIKKHTYLAKACEYAPKGYKYLVIPDTQIQPKTYNTVFFEIPEDFVGTNFQIIQSSAPASELESDIFSDDKIPSSANSSNGILIKRGKITAKANQILALVTSNQHKAPKTYAVIVVFSD